ncbi:MAG: GNAT family N-acetyltransferase [Bacteroidota bacterium]|nr:GNAT family N-acetyltransferase [Bacteroidota bacterium]
MFKTRKATIEDIPLIRQLTFRVWPQTYATILSPQKIEYMLEMMYSESSLKKQIAEDGCQFIFVYDDTEPVGFASYQEIKPGAWKLHKIYILISQQGKGTGKFVIEHIIKEISQQGATSLQLQVNRNNKAKGFYEKLGFTVIEEIDLDIGNGFFMDDYVMEKKLTANSH